MRTDTLQPPPAATDAAGMPSASGPAAHPASDASTPAQPVHVASVATSHLPHEAAVGSQSALDVLRADHHRLDALFADYARMGEGGQRVSDADHHGLVSRIGATLRAHAQIEQDILYPAIGAVHRAVLDASRSHHARALAQVQALARNADEPEPEPARNSEADAEAEAEAESGADTDTAIDPGGNGDSPQPKGTHHRAPTLADGADRVHAVAALAAEVRAHLQFEEAQVFPLLQGHDTAALGARLAMRRGALLADQGVD